MPRKKLPPLGTQPLSATIPLDSGTTHVLFNLLAQGYPVIGAQFEQNLFSHVFENMNTGLSIHSFCVIPRKHHSMKDGYFYFPKDGGRRTPLLDEPLQDLFKGIFRMKLINLGIPNSNVVAGKIIIFTADGGFEIHTKKYAVKKNWEWWYQDVPELIKGQLTDHDNETEVRHRKTSR